MVLRIFWNVGAGLLHRAVNKKSIQAGLAIDKHYPAIWRARTGFLDCDVNLHLNNASYLFCMELARWHFTAVTGILYQAVKHRRMFLAGSQAIRYRHPIPPFSSYEIRTQIAYWDPMWIYFLHQFQCPTTGKVFAEGLCRVTVKQGERRISGQEMYAEIVDEGVDVTGPTEMPEVVKEFLNWDAASRKSMEVAEEQVAQKQEQAQTSSTKQTSFQHFWSSFTRSMNLPF